LVIRWRIARFEPRYDQDDGDGDGFTDEERYRLRPTPVPTGGPADLADNNNRPTSAINSFVPQ
jgi:hypothetical protein